MDEPKLKQIIRPLISLIIIVALSVALFVPSANEELLTKYAIWGGIVISTYFGIRQVEKFFNRKK